jgi:hypothetical protein
MNEVIAVTQHINKEEKTSNKQRQNNKHHKHTKQAIKKTETNVLQSKKKTS